MRPSARSPPCLAVSCPSATYPPATTCLATPTPCAIIEPNRIGKQVFSPSRGRSSPSNGPRQFAGREPQQPVAQLLLPSPPPGTGLPGLAPVLPQPPPLRAEPAARAGRQESGATTRRQPPSPLAGLRFSPNSHRCRGHTPST